VFSASYPVLIKGSFRKDCCFEYTVVEWSGKHLTPAGKRGKQVFGAQWNEQAYKNSNKAYENSLLKSCFLFIRQGKDNM
jgi:hypothetical protein